MILPPQFRGVGETGGALWFESVLCGRNPISTENRTVWVPSPSATGAAHSPGCSLYFRCSANVGLEGLRALARRLRSSRRATGEQYSQRPGWAFASIHQSLRFAIPVIRNTLPSLAFFGYCISRTMWCLLPSFSFPKRSLPIASFFWA